MRLGQKIGNFMIFMNQISKSFEPWEDLSVIMSGNIQYLPFHAPLLTSVCLTAAQLEIQEKLRNIGGKSIF